MELSVVSDIRNGYIFVDGRQTGIRLVRIDAHFEPLCE